MKQNVFTWTGLVLLIILAMVGCKQSDQPTTLPSSSSKKKERMKLNAGIVTAKLAESKEFYQRVLNLGVTFENDFYILMHTPTSNRPLPFCCPITPLNSLSFKPLLPARVYSSLSR